MSDLGYKRLGPLGWERIQPLVDEYEQATGEPPWRHAIQHSTGRWRLFMTEGGEVMQESTDDVVALLKRRIEKERRS